MPQRPHREDRLPEGRHTWHQTARVNVFAKKIKKPPRHWGETPFRLSALPFGVWSILNLNYFNFSSRHSLLFFFFSTLTINNVPLFVLVYLYTVKVDSWETNGLFIYLTPNKRAQQCIPIKRGFETDSLKTIFTFKSVSTDRSMDWSV